MKILACVASVLLTGTACFAQPQPAGEVSLLQLKLINSGREPLQELRHTPAVGIVDKVEITTRKKATTTLNGAPEEDGNEDLSIRFTVQAEVTKQDENGTELTIEVLGAVATKPGEKPGQLKIRNDALAKLKGAKGVVAVLASGEVSKAEVQAVGAVPAVATEGLKKLNEAFSDLFPPLPSEPVGAGASWALRELTPDGPAKKDHDFSFTLLGSPKDRVVIGGSAARPITADEMGMDTTGMPVTYNNQKAVVTSEYTLMAARALPFKVSYSQKVLLDFTIKHPSGKSIRVNYAVENSVSLKQLPIPGAKEPAPGTKDPK